MLTTHWLGGLGQGDFGGDRLSDRDVVLWTCHLKGSEESWTSEDADTFPSGRGCITIASPVVESIAATLCHI